MIERLIGILLVTNVYITTELDNDNYLMLIDFDHGKQIILKNTKRKTT